MDFEWQLLAKCESKSDMEEEQVQTNMALMAFSDSERSRVKQYEINRLKTEFEKVKQEKDAIDFKIEKFGKASKDLDQLLGSQITDKSKKGFGYSAVPPPHPLIYNRPNKLDLSYSGLDEFKEPEFKGYGPENNKKESNVVCDKESENSKDNSVKSLVEEQVSQVKSSFVEGCGSNTSKSVSEVEPKKVRKNNDAPIIEDWVSDDEEQDESKTKPEKKTVIPTAAKIEKPVKKSVRYAEMYRSQSPRGNQRNWNGQKSNQLGSEFVMYNKACFICGSFNHVQKNYTYHQKKKVGKPQHDDKDLLTWYNKEENSQDCIVMPIWKDTSYLDSPTKNVDNGEPKTADDAQKHVEDVNTASPDVNTGSLKLNVVVPTVKYYSSPNEEDITKEEPEVDLGDIKNSYIVPTTSNTRIHKDHLIDNVIGEVQKFNYSDVKSASTPVDLEKPLVKDGDADDVYVHLYRRLMIGVYVVISLHTRPDIMFSQTVVATSTTEAEYVAAAS
ncbi:hypothetical protein Tco_1238897 [Tanacetum coccineum]